MNAGQAINIKIAVELVHNKLQRMDVGSLVCRMTFTHGCIRKLASVIYTPPIYSRGVVASAPDLERAG